MAGVESPGLGGIEHHSQKRCLHLHLPRQLAWEGRGRRALHRQAGFCSFSELLRTSSDCACDYLTSLLRYSVSQMTCLGLWVSRAQQTEVVHQLPTIRTQTSFQSHPKSHDQNDLISRRGKHHTGSKKYARTYKFEMSKTLRDICTSTCIRLMHAKTQSVSRTALS